MRIGVLVGNPRPESRTLQVAKVLREALLAALPGATAGDVLDSALVAQDVFGPSSGDVAARLGAVAANEVVIVATPTYRGTYTGLLKAVLDLSGRQTWSGVVAVPVQVVGSAHHALAGEVHLRPLLVELGAVVAGKVLVVTEADLAIDGGREAVETWLRDPAGGGALRAQVASRVGVGA